MSSATSASAAPPPLPCARSCTRRAGALRHRAGSPNPLPNSRVGGGSLLSAYRAGPRTPYGTDTTGCRWDPAGLTEIPRREIEIPRREIEIPQREIEIPRRENVVLFARDLRHIHWQAMVKEAAGSQMNAEDIGLDGHELGYEAMRERCSPPPLNNLCRQILQIAPHVLTAGTTGCSMRRTFSRRRPQHSPLSIRTAPTLLSCIRRERAAQEPAPSTAGRRQCRHRRRRSQRVARTALRHPITTPMKTAATTSC